MSSCFADNVVTRGGYPKTPWGPTKSIISDGGPPSRGLHDKARDVEEVGKRICHVSGTKKPFMRPCHLRLCGVDGSPPMLSSPSKSMSDPRWTSPRRSDPKSTTGETSMREVMSARTVGQSLLHYTTTKLGTFGLLWGTTCCPFWSKPLPEHSFGQ